MFIKIGDMLINLDNVDSIKKGVTTDYDDGGEREYISFAFVSNNQTFIWSKDDYYLEAVAAYNAVCKGAMTFDNVTAIEHETTPSFLARVQAILHNANIGYTDGEQRPDNTARLTIAREDVPKLDNLPIKYDLIWRTDTSARIEVLSIGDNNNTPAPFVCEMCGCECNGAVRNGHLYCSECLTELDEPYEPYE